VSGRQATAASAVRVESAPDAKLRVVYVGGSGHSGSTLLAMLLDSHPQIVSLGETAVKPKIRHKGRAAQQKCSCGQEIASCEFWREIFERVRAEGFDLAADRWSNDYRMQHPVLNRLLTQDTSHPLLGALRRVAKRAVPAYRSRLERIDAVNVAFVRAALQTARADVFCDTTKDAGRLSRLLRIADLDVKVIILVRDVRGYAASSKRRGRSIEDAAATWRKDQERLVKVTRSLPENRKLVLRYEDLCGSPAPTLERLYRFCGVRELTPVIAVRSDNHHVLGNNMRTRGPIEVRLDESWRARLTADEQQRIMQVAGELNRAMGYE
jgi:hypothetical protein